MLETRKEQIEKELSELNQTLTAGLAEIKENKTAIEELEASLETARELEASHRDKYNQTVRIERELKQELVEVKEKIEEARKEDFISTFVSEQPAFDELFKDAFRAHLDDISNAYSVFDGNREIELLYRQFNNTVSFENHVIEYRGAKKRYQTQLEAIGELFYYKRAVPLAQSNALAETYKGLARHPAILSKVGAV